MYVRKSYYTEVAVKMVILENIRSLLQLILSVSSY